LKNLKTCLPGSNWLRPWLLCVLLASIYCLATLARLNWNPMEFVAIGKQFDPVQGSAAGMGYDGQFAYQIAIDPLHAAAYLDMPAYRYQRMLYPLLARVLALGNPAAIPWALLGINLASLALGTLATELILVKHGRSRWYALAYGLFAGLFISIRLDLTEPLAFALVQWAVLYFDRGRLGRSLLLFVLASLTRELTLIFAAGCVLSLLCNQRWRSALLWGGAAVLPFGIWQIVLRLWLGSWGVGSGGLWASPFEWVPYRGWWGMAYTQSPERFILLSLVILLVALVPATLAIAAGLRAISRRRFGPGVWMLLLNALIFPFLPSSNMLHIPGLLRVAIGLVAAVINYGAFESSPRALRYSQLWLLLLVFGEGLIT